MTENRRTNHDIKRINKNRIFRYVISHGRTSNPEMAYELKMSLPTVMSNVKELLSEGYLKEAGEMESTGGRKARSVVVSEDTGIAVGMDVTQHHIVFVLTNLTGRNLDRKRVYVPFRNDESWWLRMHDLLEEFLDEHNIDRERLSGVGISVPGIVNIEKERISQSRILGIEDLPFSKIEKYVPYNYKVMNDANAGAFAELFHADNRNSFFYLSLNNTVGGALCVNRKLIQGEHFRCGDIAHATLIPGGDQCTCGRAGCVEQYCSAVRLGEIEEDRHLDDTIIHEFFRRLDAGEERETRYWDLYSDKLALLIDNIHLTFDYDVIVGGYVGSAMGDNIETIRRKVSERAASRGAIRTNGADFIRPCNYRSSESAFGAALRLVEDLIKTI